MAVQVKQVTVEEFERWVELPENADRLFEYVGGEVIPVPSNPYSSYVASRINHYLFVYVDHHRLGYVTGEAGGYRVGGERYAPDVAYISSQRQAALPESGYNPLPPDLAVEVLSPSDDPANIRIKVTNYLAAGTTVWIVDPERKRIEVHAPGQPVTQVKHDGVLDGGALLPGFTLALKDVFPE